MGLSFPFDPAQIALVSYTVGTPAFLFTLFAKPERLDPNIIHSLFQFSVSIALVSTLFGTTIYASNFYLNRESVPSGELPARAIEAYRSYTGVDFGDEGFENAHVTIFAQTSLSFFIGLTSMIVVYFLYPPISFFAVWRNEIVDDKRIAWLNLALIALLIIVYLSPLSAFVGLLPQPPSIITILIVMTILWTVCVRQMFKSKLFDRFLEVG